MRQCTIRWRRGSDSTFRIGTNRGRELSSVAERLSISEVTVKTHLNNIFQKLGLRGRTALALYAIRVGIIGVEERGS